MSVNVKSLEAKAVAAAKYISLHRKQLAAAVAAGAALLEAIQKAH